MNPLFLELVRQCLRWVGVWLMTVGVPEEVASLTSRQDFIVFVAGLVSYAAADTGWAVSLWNRLTRRGVPDAK